MKITKFIIVILMPLLTSGCIEDLKSINPKNLLESGEIKGASFGERHLVAIESTKETLTKNHDDYENACLKLNCSIVYSYVYDNEKAYLKALISNANIDKLIKSSDAKIAGRSLIKGTVSSLIDIQKRLEIKELIFNSLISDFNNSPSNPLAVEQELERLQSEIETLKMIIKAKEKPLEIPAKETAENKEKTETALIKNPKLVLLEVTFETNKPLGGFNMSLIETALKKSYKIAVFSASQAIVFMALVLPWLPLAFIIMWLLSIVFKHKIKIKTISQETNFTPNNRGGIGGLFAKKTDSLDDD